MLRCLILSSICSVLLSACGKRPDIDIKGVNTAPLKGSTVRQYSTVSYNARSDYDNDGNLLSSAKPKIVTYPTCDEFAASVNGNWCIAPVGIRELKASLKTARETEKALRDACGADCWGL